MHRIALAIVLSVPILAAACVCDVADGPKPTEGALGLHHGAPAPDPIAEWISYHRGPRVKACAAAHDGSCNWKATCAVIDWVNCGDEEGNGEGGTTLSCSEAENAARGDVAGIQMCWIDCSGLDD
jgi:hypothetical protein